MAIGSFASGEEAYEAGKKEAQSKALNETIIEGAKDAWAFWAPRRGQVRSFWKGYAEVILNRTVEEMPT